MTQVDPSKHYGSRYLTLPRQIHTWYQAREVTRLTPDGGSVLEIGPGPGYTTFLLRTWGVQVTTMDLDSRLAPDVVADVARLGFADETFDCVLAAQVLEHIPFAEFKTALCELARVTRRYVVITLPAPLVGVAAVINTPLFPELGFVAGFPYWIRHRFNGQHYWELGKRGFSLKRISREINSAGLRIINRFRPAPSLYSYFICCEKVLMGPRV